MPWLLRSAPGEVFAQPTLLQALPRRGGTDRRCLRRLLSLLQPLSPLLTGLPLLQYIAANHKRSSLCGGEPWWL